MRKRASGQKVRPIRLVKRSGGVQKTKMKRLFSSTDTGRIKTSTPGGGFVGFSKRIYFLVKGKSQDGKREGGDRKITEKGGFWGSRKQGFWLG